ncbi:carbonate dehydratase [Piscinibacter koreensis]|nr:carbonate dehydratase [Schlegelella koreensis]
MNENPTPTDRPMNDLEELFEKNREWARETEATKPGFFSRLLQQQAPQYLWIGCADSRVPANEILGLLPGDVFVHRNVANVVVHSDLNALSVMQFAIDILAVKHIFVVGHYGCGGVTAALHDRRVGLADNWIRHVKDVRNKHWDVLAEITDPALQVDALCELNVLEQVHHVCSTTVVQDAWSRGAALIVHGWVYGLHDGLLVDLSISAGNAEAVETAYQSALEALRERYAHEQRTPQETRRRAASNAALKAIGAVRAATPR